MAQDRARVRIGPASTMVCLPQVVANALRLKAMSSRRLPRSEIAIFAPDVRSIALDVWRLNAAPGRRIRGSALVAVRDFRRLHAGTSRSEPLLAHTSLSGCGE